MRITINGKDEIINAKNITILELLKLKNVKMPEMVTVELNGEIIDREDFPKKIIKENDIIEFLYYMGGGKNWKKETYKQK